MSTTPVPDVAELTGDVAGRVITAADPDHDALRAGFNGMIDKKPLAIVRAQTEADAAAAIRFAREYELPLALRSGGHSAPGFGSCDGGIVIDSRDLQQVEIDDEARTIRCGSGLTWAQFDAATQAHGLAVTGGRVSSTGVVGLTIGSGSGWLERAMGLTSDNLIGARLVTADGAAVDTDEDRDLLWALRGGGGSFGFVTELRFQLHPLGPIVYGGVRMYQGTRGREVLTAFRDVMSSAPRQLAGGLAFIMAPPAPFVPEEYRGTLVAAITVLWAGDVADGLAVLDALGTPIVDTVGLTPYVDIQTHMDAGAPHGWRDYFKGGFMTDLPDVAVDAIVGIAEDIRAPLTQINCAPLGLDTAYAEPDESFTAIGHRDELWSFQVLSLWDDPAEDSLQKAWTKTRPKSCPRTARWFPIRTFSPQTKRATSRAHTLRRSCAAFGR